MNTIPSPGSMLSRSARPKTERRTGKVRKMRDTQNAYIESFLETLAVERGVTEAPAESTGVSCGLLPPSWSVETVRSKMLRQRTLKST